jgi:hypothetical protein
MSNFGNSLFEETLKGKSFSIYGQDGWLPLHVQHSVCTIQFYIKGTVPRECSKPRGTLLNMLKLGKDHLTGLHIQNALWTFPKICSIYVYTATYMYVLDSKGIVCANLKPSPPSHTSLDSHQVFLELGPSGRVLAGTDAPSRFDSQRAVSNPTKHFTLSV